MHREFGGVEQPDRGAEVALGRLVFERAEEIDEVALVHRLVVAL
jgi:hypothetical protein